MSEPCEICEATANAVSSCPVTDAIIVAFEQAGTLSSVELGFQPSIFIEVAGTSSTVTPSSYSVLSDVANAANTAQHSAVLVTTEVEAARGSDVLFVVLNQTLVSEVAATDGVAFANIEQVFVSTAGAVSPIVHASRTADVLLFDSASADGSISSIGLYEYVVNSVDTASPFALLLRDVLGDESSSGNASDSAFPNTVLELLTLVSLANAVSTATTDISAVALLLDTSDAVSSVRYRSSSSVAWVMNTETSAIAHYDNFGFESMCSAQGRVFAVGIDGIHELVGDTDDGRVISASVETGFNDFGVSQTKRIDNVYFGYTSAGQISVKVEVLESGIAPSTYLLETRTASAPRNSRVTPGKGLWGRYWRLTVANVAGTDLTISDTEIDVAVSSRRL